MLRQLESSIKGSCLSREIIYVIRTQGYLKSWRSSWPIGAVVMEGHSHCLSRKREVEEYLGLYLFLLPNLLSVPFIGQAQPKARRWCSSQKPISNRMKQRTDSRSGGWMDYGGSIPNNQCMQHVMAKNIMFLSSLIPLACLKVIIFILQFGKLRLILVK